MALLECLVPREGDTHIVRDGIKYTFLKTEDGRALGMVAHEAHVRQLVASGMFRLADENQNMQPVQTAAQTGTEDTDTGNDDFKVRTIAPECKTENPRNSIKERDPMDQILDMKGQIAQLEAAPETADAERQSVINDRINELRGSIAATEQRLGIDGEAMAPKEQPKKRTRAAKPENPARVKRAPGKRKSPAKKRAPRKKATT